LQEKIAGGVREGEVDAATLLRHRLRDVRRDKHREVTGKLVCEYLHELLFDLGKRRSAVDVLDLGQKADFLAMQFQFDLRIETRIESTALSRQEFDRAPGLGAQGFNGLVEDTAFGLGEMIHRGIRSTIRHVHET
jgi:hypothetical protein